MLVSVVTPRYLMILRDSRILKTVKFGSLTQDLGVKSTARVRLGQEEITRYYIQTN